MFGQDKLGYAAEKTNEQTKNTFNSLLKPRPIPHSYGIFNTGAQDRKVEIQIIAVSQRLGLTQASSQ